MKKEFNYELITADRYEQVLASADTLEGLAKLIRMDKSALAHALTRKSIVAGKYRVIKVNTNDYDFNFYDYLDFCKTDGLEPKKASSLQRFKEYCGETYEF